MRDEWYDYLLGAKVGISVETCKRLRVFFA
jgi:hypothetical protein